MNKNYLKLCVVTVTILLSFFTFLSTRYEYSNIGSTIVPISFLISLPIFMHIKYKDLKNSKIKTPYLITMTILYLISISIILFIMYDIFFPIAYQVDENNIKIPTNIFIKFDNFKMIFSTFLFMITSWLMLLFSFIDLEKTESKTNYILTIVVSLIIIIIHIHFYINPNLKEIINIQMVGEKASYIIQNYIYFGLMYMLILINCLRKTGN